MTPGTWLTAFHLAVVCRERDRITALCRVPLSLLRDNKAQFDAFEYAWVDALQTYWLGGDGLSAKLVAAIDGTDPADATHAEAAGKLMYPPMEMFHRVVHGGHVGFSRALATALEWHREYWSGEGRAARVLRLVALAPLAVACFARNEGIPIGFEATNRSNL